MTLCPNCSQALEEASRFCPSCGTKIGEGLAAEGSLLGTTLNDKYRVISELGTGSMGTVYLGEHLSLKKQVALKVLHTDLQIGQEALIRFQREGIAAGKFNHPGAIQIFDFDVEGKDTWYLAMEYVEGCTLKQYMIEEGALDVPSALDLMAQILSVLAEAHRQGIVHRDLKPENIMVRKSAMEETTIKVLDFGLSKLLDQPEGAGMMTQTGRIMGTPMYMSPEQCSGKDVDHRTDLYSAGLILFELLAGTTPFQAESMNELLVKHLSEIAPSVVDSNPKLSIPEGVDNILDRALSKSPSQRFGSATQMLVALEAVDLERIGQARRGNSRRTTLNQSVAPQGSEVARIAIFAFIGILTLVTAAGSAFLFWPSDRADYSRLTMHATEALAPVELQYVELLKQTRRSLRNWELETAMVRVGDALALPCHDSEGFFLRGAVYAARGDLDTAAADYVEALDLDPDYVDARAGLGWLALQSKDKTAAAEHFELAATIDENSPQALAGVGALQFEAGEYDTAEELLRKAVARDSHLALGHEYLGRTLLALGNYEGAQAALIEAKRENARSWRSYEGLGEAYMALGRSEDAETQFREAIKLRPEGWQLKLSLASLLVGQGRHADAKELTVEALAKEPKNGRLHVLMALIASEEGASTTKVIASLEEALSLGAGSADLHLLLGLQFMEVGRHEAATSQFLTALEFDDENAKAHTDLGLAYAAQNLYPNAVLELERAVELDAENQFLRLTLGVLYMDFANSGEQALEQFTTYQGLGGADTRVTGWIATLEG
ncbi:MAG: serine/threonine protein kinase/Flp pilus assembly protein TadD [Candidatus Paceibacteria bacterium]|jgi:serine/threonine protein kinase/Flp pilus assembly protein TadD